MSVSVALNNALSGLNVNQQALSVLSQNIANANTAGYSRQSLNLRSVSIDGQGQGVNIESITRKVDEYLIRAAQTQNSQVGQTGVLTDYYTKIQLLLGAPGDKNSIDAYVNTFFNAVQSLSQSPDNTTLQQTAVNSAVTVTGQLNQLSRGLGDLQFQADQDIALAVQQINIDLKAVGELNKLIAQDTSLGRSTADMEDQRDGLIRNISGFIPINTFRKSDGALFLTTSNGISILDSNNYRLSYTPATSVSSFSKDSAVSALRLLPIDKEGNVNGTTVDLTTEGAPSEVTTQLDGGKIKALLDMRDRLLPGITSQIDSIAANMRDGFNEVHNLGSGYPGTNSFTGTRMVNAADYSEWSGKVRFALLDSNGQPLVSSHPDEPYGAFPLTIDLSTFDTGNGPGKPSVQGIINTINQYYGIPQNKVRIANLNDIQLTSTSERLPNTSQNFTFDFNLNNISDSTSKFFVTGVSVQDALGAAMPTTSTVPAVTLSGTNTYTTYSGQSRVTVNTASTHNLQAGDWVYLTTPPNGPDFGGTYGAIPPSALGGYVRITGVSPTGFDFTSGGLATSGNSFSVAGQSATPHYAAALPGVDTRTKGNGFFAADISSNTTSNFYDVTVDVGVDDGNGSIMQSQISYRVFSNQPAMLNRPIGARSSSLADSLIEPSNYAQRASARLVDANGVELPQVNGQYAVNQNGYLQIRSHLGTTYLAIDSLDSRELGKPSFSTATAGSNRSFSHYFELNNFFTSNSPDASGDKAKGSAYGISVEQRIRNNNGLLSVGSLSRGSKAVTLGAVSNYTYQLNPGDNSTVARLAAVSTRQIFFAATGGLGATTQSITGYIGQFIGGIATDAGNANRGSSNAQALYDSYVQQQSAVSGVNLDTELANTVIYQNAYAASARVIAVTSQLFDALLESV